MNRIWLLASKNSDLTTEVEALKEIDAERNKDMSQLRMDLEALRIAVLDRDEGISGLEDIIHTRKDTNNRLGNTIHTLEGTIRTLEDNLCWREREKLVLEDTIIRSTRELERVRERQSQVQQAPTPQPSETPGPRRGLLLWAVIALQILSIIYLACTLAGDRGTEESKPEGRMANSFIYPNDNGTKTLTLVDFEPVDENCMHWIALCRTECVDRGRDTTYTDSFFGMRLHWDS